MEINKIKLLCKKNKITYSELGKILNLSPVSIGLKLNNKREFTQSELVTLSDFFEMTIDELVR